MLRSSTVGRFYLRRIIHSKYVALVVLLTVSAGLNVLLARRVRQLQSTMIEPLRQQPLQIGAAVPPITATGLDGQSEKVSYAGGRNLTILYVFTPQCGWCERNIPNLKALIKAKGQDNRFIGLSLSQAGLTDYVRTHELTLPVLTELTPQTISAYRLGSTPQTLVISPDGRVVQNWRGAWTNKQQSEVEAFFKVTLPGIQQAISTPKL